MIIAQFLQFGHALKKVTFLIFVQIFESHFPPEDDVTTKNEYERFIYNFPINFKNLIGISVALWESTQTDTLF